MIVKTAVYNEIKARNRPSFYATPVAWAAANFTQLLIDDEGGMSRLSASEAPNENVKSFSDFS